MEGRIRIHRPMPDGQLAPIDLRVQSLAPALAEIVKKLCGNQL